MAECFAEDSQNQFYSSLEKVIVDTEVSSV